MKKLQRVHKLKQKNNKSFETLIEIMEILRGPGVCPWDQEQTIESLKPYLIEETYEVLEAMSEEDHKLKDELGDLLLQIVFQSQIKKEINSFDVYDVIEAINEKLIRRHPHIFGNVKVKDSEEVLVNWDRIKKEEKSHKNRKSALDGIPKNLPSILKAYKIQHKAAKVGFDWENLEGALEKMDEEIEELKVEHKNQDKEKFENELGDVMFSLINVARLAKIDPDEALRKTIKKFTKRFRYIEDNTDIEKADLEAMEKLWEEAKSEIG
ncbi:nucleoside triphosphate pyrophosphohydrolase [Haliovirga abyssi]|uniref:NTP pyrophosphohydrolase MazG-like domain-containing protein n=1 Tax=Haliovirga abyssi TaxID=2996794 RepID=A0AAU9D5Z2_9FUSO|nr:nucleoside triphosphate pyrophosphohydrolase [Haliovirga abyssi]BDU51491.1 hypothetical protein HLVA_20600 [Haliovirga abyssi]